MANTQRPPAGPSPLAQLLRGAMRFLCSFFTIFVINLEDQLVESPPRKLVVPNIRGKYGDYVNKL